ncbi:MAG: DUF2244 domain-containing protein [Proteobacteria bacterium]|nr:DUF2244 domain-containing protein [Pseudomonadota bacterium]
MAEPPAVPPAEETARAADAPVLFDVLLMPNRSLPPLGFALLMAAVSLLSFGAGVTFYLIGAWPVIGFLGLDVALIYIAFRISFRRLRAFETLRLTEQALVLERVSPGGVRRRWTFQPYWLRVEFDDPPHHGSQLRLRSHGRAVTVGAFLAPPERQDLAAALRQALHRLKNPAFDHDA